MIEPVLVDVTVRYTKDDILHIIIDGVEFTFDRKQAFTIQHILNQQLLPVVTAQTIWDEKNGN